MNRRLFLHEIVKELEILPTLEDRIRFIQEQSTPRLFLLFQYIWDKTVVFDVEIPEFKIDSRPVGFGDINLYAELRRFYIFTTMSKIDQKKKKSLLFNLLSSVSREETTFIIDLITHNIRNYPNMTKELVSAVYPQIPLAEVVENKEQEKVVDQPVIVQETLQKPKKRVSRKKVTIS